MKVLAQNVYVILEIKQRRGNVKVLAQNVCVILEIKQRRGNVKVLAPEAFFFIAWRTLCGRELLVLAA